MSLNHTTLSEVCIFKQCGGTPNILDERYWTGNLPWLSSGETSSLFINDTEKHITEQAALDYGLKLIPKYSIVIARSGQGHTRGQVSMCMIETYVNDGLIVLMPDCKMVNPLYLLYNLHSRYEEIRQLSDANSCRGNLNVRILGSMSIDLPSIEEQNKTSHILFGLDRLTWIINNINDNLGGAVVAS